MNPLSELPIIFPVPLQCTRVITLYVPTFQSIEFSGTHPPLARKKVGPSADYKKNGVGGSFWKGLERRFSSNARLFDGKIPRDVRGMWVENGKDVVDGNWRRSFLPHERGDIGLFMVLLLLCFQRFIPIYLNVDVYWKIVNAWVVSKRRHIWRHVWLSRSVSHIIPYVKAFFCTWCNNKYGMKIPFEMPHIAR